MANAKLPKAFRAVIRPIESFFALEAASGILLAFAALLALVWANSPWAESYRALFHAPISVSVGSLWAAFKLDELVNDGLMTVFFLLVGLEIKRELAVGELSSVRKAMLPLIAALGGMLAPALIYVALTRGTGAESGWGIPMATDIAFSIGCLTLLKKRVSHGLIVYLTALAIFDDLGGILVIALFYGSGIHLPWLGAAAGVGVVLWLFNRMHLGIAGLYAVAGILLWWTLHHAGIHATLAGVMVGLAVPATSPRSPREILAELSQFLSEVLARAPAVDVDAQELLHIEETIEDLEPPLNRFVHALHSTVAYGIVPLFALANSGVSVQGMGWQTLMSPVCLGVGLGLVLGKPLGIFGFTWGATRLGLGDLPAESTYPKILGVASIAGIGFTVALFIANLAFANAPALLNEAKLGILLGSLVSAILGMSLLKLTRARAHSKNGFAPAVVGN
jgi:NhaA family Na+:H+ antiporter